MDMNTTARYDDMKYNYSKFDRKTWAAPHDSRTVIKYIAPRVIAPKASNSFQGSSRGVAWSRVGSNLPPATPTDSGLATLVQSSTYSTISSLHSIDGERIIDEQRELSQITETLAQTILQWCCLGTHNRAVELQIEWLEERIDENRSIIEQMFRTEIESAKKQVKETLQNKPELQAKVLEALKAIPAHDEKYQKLLSKRNALNKELFDFERKIAQNNAESQFLQRRTRQLDDESKFYLLKNQAFDGQRVRLRYELDEEKFAQETLKAELEILHAEKITNEDIRVTSVHDARNSVDTFQLVGIQFSKYYSNQLNEEVRRIRDEYEKKITVYREELHRKCELELYRYEMHKSRPVPSVTRDHEFQLEQYHQSQKDIVQQINGVRGSISEIMLQIETVERNLMSRKHDENSQLNRKEQLIMFNQSIHERERQLDEAIRIRKGLKEKIEIYKERLNRYPRNSTQNYYNKRVTIHDSYEPIMSTSSSIQNSKFRSSLNDVSYGTRDRERSPIPTRLPPSIIRSSSPERAKRWSVNQTEGFQEEGTLTRYPNFNINQDCEELYRLLNDSTIDEIAIIQIICNRSVDQRLIIRDEYKNRFHQNLSDAFEKIRSENLSKILRTLLLPPVERDCFELRRILKRATIDENILVEIFFSRSNKHIQTVRETYQKLFKTTLEQDIIADRESYSKRIFITVLESNRPEDNDVNDNEILKDARDLYETEAQWRVDGSTFVRLLCTRSNAQLKKIFAAYQQFDYSDIEQRIQAHIEGNLCDTLIAIIRIIRNRPRFFAYQLRKCLKGAATDEECLNRIIVTRCEIDMVQIQSEYEKIAQRTLYDHLQTDIKGNYKRAVLELIRQHFEPNTRGMAFQYSNENPNRSTVQWRNPISRFSPDTDIKRPLTRSSSERTVYQGRQMNDNQASAGSLWRTNIKPSRTYSPDHRRFGQLSPTIENRLELNGDEE